MKTLLISSIIMLSVCGIASAQTDSKATQKHLQSTTTSTAAPPTPQKAAIMPASDAAVALPATTTDVDAAPAATTQNDRKQAAKAGQSATTVNAAGVVVPVNDDAAAKRKEAKMAAAKAANAPKTGKQNSDLVQDKMQIGKIENSVPVITANKEMLIKNYSKNLLELSGITGNFTDVSIVLADGSYYLVFKGSKYRSSLQLTSTITADNSTTFSDDGGHVSCTTSDCASEPTGCVPSPVGLSCTPCANKGKCTKTVSSLSLLK